MSGNYQHWRRRDTLRAIGLPAALWLAFCGAPPASAAQGAEKMIDYSVSPVRSGFVSGEDVSIRLEITNTGTDGITIPHPDFPTSSQPVHTLTGPGWKEPVYLTNRRIVTPGAGLDPAANQKLLTIAPGRTWGAQFEMNSVVGRLPHGEYRLESMLAWQNVSVQSPSSAFHIGPLEPSSISLGLGVRPFDQAEGEGALLQRGEQGTGLYTFQIKEIRPAIGEAMLMPSLFRLTTAKDATDVAVPCRNAPFFNELLRWVVWREGRNVKALSSISRAPVSVESPVEAGYLVRPPLKTTDGPVEVLMVSKDQSELGLVSFTAGMGEAGSEAHAGWRTKLPAPPQGIIAALGPESSGSVRHVAFVAQHGEGFQIFHARYAAGRPLEAFNSASVPVGHPLEGVTPAVFVEADGRVHVITLALTGPHSRRAEFVEAIFGANGEPAGTPTVTSLGDLPGKAVTGAVLFADSQGVLARRDAVIQIEGNHLLRMKEGRLDPVASPGRPTSPILLAPGKNTSYIIFFDPARGLSIEPL